MTQVAIRRMPLLRLATTRPTRSINIKAQNHSNEEKMANRKVRVSRSLIDWQDIPLTKKPHEIAEEWLSLGKKRP